MVKPGKPLEMWTSTETQVPMAPVRVAEAMHASMPVNGRPVEVVADHHAIPSNLDSSWLKLGGG